MVTCAMRTSGSGCATPIPRDQALHMSPSTGGEQFVCFLHLCPQVSGNACQAHKSLPDQTWRDRRGQLSPSALAGLEGAIPLTLTQAGAASPCQLHQNHKFTVGLLRSPPILHSGYVPRLAAYLGV